MLGGAAPTGLALIDALYVGIGGAALVLAGGRARRVAWLASATLTLWVAPSTGGRIIAIVAILAVLVTVRTGRRRIVGALVGVALAFVLGDLGSGPFLGATTLYAAVAAAPMLVSGALLMPVGWRRPLGLAISTAAACAVLATMLFGLSALLSMSDVGDGVDAATIGFDLAGEGEQAGSAEAFDDAAAAFDRARGKVSGFWTLPARLVPVLAHQVRAVQVTTAEGAALATTAADTARSVDPDDVHLVEGRLDLALLHELQPVLDRARRALERATARVEGVRTPWLVPPVADRMDRLLDDLDRARPSAETASLAVTHLPTMLGGEGAVHWLVLFTTPAEARGLGGLVGNWALIRADDGAIDIVARGRNEDVNARLRARDVTLVGPEQYVDRWRFFEPNRFFQDVTLSPDLPMTAEVSAHLFEAAMDQRVDGVIVLDPYALRAVLELTGPIDTATRRLTAETIVPFLLVDQYVEFADDEIGRVLALNSIVDGAFEAFTSGALPGPRAIAAEFGPVIEQDRLGAWWRAGGGPTELLAATGLDGTWPDPGGGDLVGLVHQNAGQNKLDTFLRRSLAYDLDVGDGAATGTVTVTLHNTLDDLDLPDAIVASNDQGFPRGTNVVRLGIHTRLSGRSLRVDGADTAFNRQPAFGGEVATVVVEVPAGATRTVELTIGGPLELDADEYRLTVPYQPLVNDDELHVDVVIDGSPVELDAPPVLRSDLVLTAGAD